MPDGTQIDYVIDAQDRRVGKKVNGTLVQGWLYGNQLNPIAELDGNGNAIVPIRLRQPPATSPTIVVKGGVTYRIISYHLGSPRLVITRATARPQRLDYD